MFCSSAYADFNVEGVYLANDEWNIAFFNNTSAPTKSKAKIKEL